MSAATQSVAPRNAPTTQVMLRFTGSDLSPLRLVKLVLACAVSILCQPATGVAATTDDQVQEAAAQPWNNKAFQPTPMPQTLDYGLILKPVVGPWYVLPGTHEDFSVKNGCNIINTVVRVDATGRMVINTGPSFSYGVQQRALIERSLHKPVTHVLSLNLHPDYFFGNQAYADTPTWATRRTIDGATREGGAYADNLYRLCGDWMKATESTPPKQPLTVASPFLQASHLQWMELSGHTDSDLVLFDTQYRVLIAGGLVFNHRVPTTPHADIPTWLKSLAILKALNPAITIPSHRPVSAGTTAIDETADYLTWLDATMKTSALSGLELIAAMQLPIPDRFKSWVAMPAEFARSVTRFYPSYEQAALSRP